MSMEIKVLGTGCKKCKALEKSVTDVVAELGVDARIEKVVDINAIADHGVFVTPGLIINGRVKAAGKLPNREQIKKYIKEEM